eukprot:198638_1
MNPFGTLPQYGFDYWPKKNKCKIIQIDIDHRRLGLTINGDDNVYINGDAYLSTKEILNGIKEKTKEHIECLKTKNERIERVFRYKKEWEHKLNGWTNDGDLEVKDGKIRPRKALRELEKVIPKNAIVSTDIGNICSLSNSYLRFDENPSFLAA